MPDRRYRRGYRLTPEGIRVRRRRRVAVTIWVLLLIVAGVAHSAVFAVLVTCAVAGYGVHRYRVSHRAPPPPPPPVYLPPPATGERRTRQPPSREVRQQVWLRDGGRCKHCGCTDEQAMAASGEHLHYDHIVPFSKNGADTVGNLQLLCGPCNRRKGAGDIAAG